MSSPASLKAFSQRLRALPRVVAQRVTEAAAPVITALAIETFGAGETAYGDSWEPGAQGQRITLYKSGTLEHQIYYVGIGSKLRVAFGVPYAKYQIGKRPVFPKQGWALPVAYAEALEATAIDVIRAELGE